MSKQKKDHRAKKRRWGRDDTELTLLALPTTIWYALFCFAPMFGIIIAFKNYKVYGNFLQSFFQSEWVGFENFEFLFSSNDIWMIIRNTLGYNIVFIILNIVVPVAAAIAIGQLHNKKMAKAYQTAMFMPYFLSWVVVSALVWAFLSFDKGLVNGMLESFGMDRQQWYMKPKMWPPFLVFMKVVVSALVWAFLSFDKGLVNGMLESFGMDRQQWYMKPKMWPPFLVFMNLWKGVGYGMVVYLATITGIDKTYYEAAGIDGATIWQQIRYITLPLMKTVMGVGYGMVVYLATITGIDKTYYEAAGIDGATIWQQIRYITLPLMKTVIVMMFIMAVGRIFYSDFGLFYQVPRDSNSLYNYVYTLDVYVYKQLKTSVMMFIMAVGRIFYSDFGLFYQVPRDSNSLYNYVYTLDVYVYKQLKTSTTGMAAAAAFVQSVMGCITILTANAIVRKVDRESAMI